MFLFKVGLFTLVNGLLDHSGKVIPIPAYYAEVIHIGEVASGDVVAIY